MPKLIYLFVLFQLVSCTLYNPIYLYDLTYTLRIKPQDSYEHSHFVAALQGIVNRKSPQLYVNLTLADETWLEYMKKSNWFNSTTIHLIPSINELTSIFSSYIKGVVLYDPNVWATSSLASTIAGVENLLPICKRNQKDSLYQQLVLGGPKLKVKRSLVDLFNGNITGSAKCDAYLWAKKEFLDSGLCDASYMGYYIDYFWTTVANNTNIPYDINTVSNHDYFIAHKGFFWDLDVWPDDLPNDDPKQPLGTDYKTLLEILLSAYNQTKGKKMIHIGGFTPWNFKYVNEKHGGVQTEWQTVMITTQYNAYLDADACCFNPMANAAFFQHFPLSKNYKQNPHPTLKQLQNLGYINSSEKVVPKTYMMFYVGDYDSASWMYNSLKSNWDDPLRGTIPLGWAMDPNLSVRFPLIFDYIFSSLTANDRIITGDSGAGYINPTQLFEPRNISRLPAANSLWVKHSTPFYQQFDISFTGFLINGASGILTNVSEQMYASLSPDGMMEQPNIQPEGLSPVHMQGSAPVFQEVDLPDDPIEAAKLILTYYQPGKLQFQVYRTILKTVSYHVSIHNYLKQNGADIQIVEPLVLSLLAKTYFQ